MATNRRWGPQNSETRTVLLDAAEQIMREDGYAAVTSRQLARSAGLSPQIVYYYFKTMDDLFEAVFLRFAEYFLAAIDEAARSEEPLIAIWELSSNPSRGIIMSELVALSNHRKGLRSLISEFGREYHARQAAIIAAELKARGLDQSQWPPAVIAAAMENMARGFVFGQGFSIEGHVDARDFITRRIHDLLGTAKPTRS